MMQAQVARWLMVVGLAFGVVCMHSFGHHGPSHGDTEPMVSVAGHDLTPEAPAQTGLLANAPGPAPFDVCLAVLTSILLFRLMATAFHARGAEFAGQAGFSRRGRPPRPPPKGLSQVLIRIAVLRI